MSDGCVGGSSALTAAERLQLADMPWNEDDEYDVDEDEDEDEDEPRFCWRSKIFTVGMMKRIEKNDPTFTEAE